MNEARHDEGQAGFGLAGFSLCVSFCFYDLLALLGLAGFFVSFFFPGICYGQDFKMQTSVQRIISSVSALSDKNMLSYQEVRQLCGEEDGLCAARLALKKLGAKARLEKIIHPDSDSIRRVKSLPSVRKSWGKGAVLHISLKRFGRKAGREILQALQDFKIKYGAAPQILEIDLRQNRGGNLKYMLRVAASFIGFVPKAIILKGKKGTKFIDVPGAANPVKIGQVRLLVGGQTASSAEIFTALLKVHGQQAAIRVRTIGTRTYGKNYLLRIVPVNHDWRLLVPAETVSVAGIVLAGGIVPDKKP